MILTSMTEALKAEVKQVSATYVCDRFRCAVVSQFQIPASSRLAVNDQLGLVCLYEGDFCLDEQVKGSLRSEFQLLPDASEAEFLPYLFSRYADKTPLYLDGCFNVAVLDKNQGSIWLFNDRWGLYPLFYHFTGKVLVFSSKLESVLSSGLFDHVDFDKATWAEHLCFNYPLSDHSYIKGIDTFPNATVLVCKKDQPVLSKYWSIAQDIQPTGLNDRESVSLLDSCLHEAVDRIMARIPAQCNISLTGGWDSRIVLSHLLPEHRERLHCFSFGAPEAADIRVPQVIAGQEGLRYTPFVLDGDYLRYEFLRLAARTVELSGGSRNYKRTHYLYAMEKVGTESAHLLTGIFGDEVFKGGKPQGGAVISRNTIDLLDAGLDPQVAVSAWRNLDELYSFSWGGSEVESELHSRITEMSKLFSGYATRSEQYLAFRFELNLRRFFGSEASSYNDFVLCHSPFIDYKFIREWLRTAYAGNRFSFSAPDLKTKQRSAALYTQLLNLRYPALSRYPSSRGFSPADVSTFAGRVRVLTHRLLTSRHASPDSFNTSETDALFSKWLMPQLQDFVPVIDLTKVTSPGSYSPDALSLAYWAFYVGRKYA